MSTQTLYTLQVNSSGQIQAPSLLTFKSENDIPSLDPLTGKVLASQLPVLSLTASIEVADAAARLALTISQAQGNVVVQADNGNSYMLVEDGDPAESADWVQIGDRDITISDVDGLVTALAGKADTSSLLSHIADSAAHAHLPLLPDWDFVVDEWTYRVNEWFVPTTLGEISSEKNFVTIFNTGRSNHTLSDLSLSHSVTIPRLGWVNISTIEVGPDEFEIIVHNQSAPLVGDYLPLAGGTMTGGINMGGNDLLNANTIEATNSVRVIRSTLGILADFHRTGSGGYRAWMSSSGSNVAAWSIQGPAESIIGSAHLRLASYRAESGPWAGGPAGGASISVTSISATAFGFDFDLADRHIAVHTPELDIQENATVRGTLQVNQVNDSVILNNNTGNDNFNAVVFARDDIALFDFYGERVAGVGNFFGLWDHADGGNAMLYTHHDVNGTSWERTAASIQESADNSYNLLVGGTDVFVADSGYLYHNPGMQSFRYQWYGLTGEVMELFGNANPELQLRVPLRVFNSDIDISDVTRGLVIRSPDNTAFRIRVDNSGALATEPV